MRIFLQYILHNSIEKFSQIYTTLPFHGDQEEDLRNCMAIGGNHRWRTAWFCFKEFNAKGFSDSQTVFFIGSGLIRNITWVIRIVLSEFGCFYFGSSIKNIIHFVNNHFYTLQIKILFSKTLTFLPQLATISSQD